MSDYPHPYALDFHIAALQKERDRLRALLRRRLNMATLYPEQDEHDEAHSDWLQDVREALGDE